LRIRFNFLYDAKVYCHSSSFTDYFSGPGAVIAPVCVCVCVQKITFEQNDLLSRYFADKFNLILSRSSLKFDGSRSWWKLMVTE